MGGGGNGLDDGVWVIQEVFFDRPVHSPAAAKVAQQSEKAIGLRGDGRVVAGILDFFKERDVPPIRFALGLLAPHQVGDGQKGDLSTAIDAHLRAGIERFEIPQEVVANPELQPLFTAIGQAADFEAGEVAASPYRFLADRAQRLDSRQPQLVRGGNRSHEVEIGGVAVDSVVADGVPAHDQCLDPGVLKRTRDEGKFLVGRHHRESSQRRLPCDIRSFTASCRSNALSSNSTARRARSGKWASRNISSASDAVNACPPSNSSSISEWTDSDGIGLAMAQVYHDLHDLSEIKRPRPGLVVVGSAPIYPQGSSAAPLYHPFLPSLYSPHPNVP